MQQSQESLQVSQEKNEIEEDQEQNEEVVGIENNDKESSQSISQSDKDQESGEDESQESSSFIEVDENIQHIVETNQFFKKKDIVKYYDKFKEIDTDGSQKIDRAEMKDFLISFGIELNDDEIKSLIKDYDEDLDQTISFQEFLIILEQIMKGKQIIHQQTQNFEKVSSSSKVAAENQIELIEVNVPIEIKEEQINLEPLFPQVDPILDKAFEFEKGISLNRLKAYINDIHPREEIEIEVEKQTDLRKSKKKRRSSKFLEMVKVKDKIKFNCCFKNIGVLALGREPRQLTDVENEIGIGLTIYFRQLKLLMILFFLFTIFSLPQISLFYTSSQNSSLDPNQDFLSFFVNSMWFRFTLGAIGKTDFFCTSVPLNQLAENYFPGLIPNQTAKYDKNFNLIQNATYFPPAPNITKMQLNCPQAGIFNLVELGISQSDSRCPSNDVDSSENQIQLLQTLNIDPVCSFRQLQANSSQFTSISQEFSKLYSLNKGIFGLNPKLMFTEACYNKTLGLNYMKKTLGDKSFQMNPQIFMLVQCLDTQFFNPINGKYNIDRAFILQIIILTDCLIVFLYVMIIIFMQRVSERAVNEFRCFQNQLETKDFAIIVSNLPSVKDYKNEQILKALLISHFENIVSSQQQQIKELQNFQKYQNQIADVFFGKINYGPFDKLMEIKNQYQQIFLQIVKSQNTQKSYFKSITQIQNKIEKQKAKYLQLQNAHYEKEQSSESIKNYLKQKGDGNIVNAFIIFRSMEGRDRAIAAYEHKNLSLNRQLFNMLCFILQCCKKDDGLLFMKKQNIIVEKASDPDHINWNNISKQHKCRKCCEGFCTFLISFLLIGFILGVLWGQSYFIDQFHQTYPPYNILGNNPQYNNLITDQSAALLDLTNGTLVYQDHQQYKILGLMTAYCDYMTLNKTNDPSQIFFDDQNTHCYNIKIWRNVIQLTNILVAFILVIWAYFSSYIFENCIGCMYSYIDTQHMYEFKTGMTLIITFLNSVIVLMLNHYDLQILPSLLQTNIDFLAGILGLNNFNLYFIYGYLPILVGDYSDLTIGWYQDVGQTICWILTIWLIVTSVFKFGQLLIHSLKLYFDANCLFSKKFGTLMRTQFDLNNLYTGSEFNISYNYVTIHFFIWICMSFSTTIPILYSITFFFLFFKYWIDKYLVLNYHRKTTTFNEQVPINQLKYFKWPIFLHVLCTFVTLSGNQMLFDTEIQNNINQNQSQQSNLNIPLSVNLGDNLKNLQASQLIDLNLVPKPQTIISRFLQIHMILIYTFWIFNLLCYIFQEQIEKFFHKIGEILQGESDDSDEDSEEQEFHCKKCEEDKIEIEEKKKRVKAFIQKGSKQNIHDNEKYNILSSEKKENRYADSSEDENQFKLEDFENNDDSFDQDHLKVNNQTRYSDDFFKEIRIDQLIQYCERNDFEMQRTIHALSKNHLFNPHLKKGSDFVGVEFNQRNMKEMIGLLRRRRKTFHRRLTQIFVKINPHIKQYFASPHEFEIPIIEDPFKDQVEILKQILIKKLDQYSQQEADENHSEDLEVALSLDCIYQKKILNELNKFPRIKQSAQSYDFLDQPHYQGVMSIYKMYIPELKTNIVIGNTKQIQDTQSQKSMDKTLQEENQNIYGDENDEIEVKQSSEKEGPLQSQKSIELQNLIDHQVDNSKQEDQI